jgi:hypothetical protein
MVGPVRPLDLDVVLVRVQQPIAPNAIEGTLHFTVDDIAARLRRRFAPVTSRPGRSLTNARERPRPRCQAEGASGRSRLAHRRW